MGLGGLAEWAVSSTTEQRLAYAAEVLARPPLEPGFSYSNAGYAVAGV